MCSRFAAAHGSASAMVKMTELIAGLAIPVVIVIAAFIMLFPRLGGDGVGTFTSGAKRGFESAVSLLPTLVLLNVTVSLFSASGLADFIAGLIAPIADMTGVPAEILPLLITRPVSGSASTAVFASVAEKYGVDSFSALCAAVIMGSSDTLAYVTAVYFSSVGIRRTRHTYPIALFVMLLCIFLSCLLVRILFG